MNSSSVGLGIYGFVLLLGSSLLNAAASTWKNKVNATVSEPYLDEFFHVRQAQLYCAGDFTYWDPKITTPPGLYLISYLLHRLGLSCEITSLRSTNAVAIGLLVFLPALRTLSGSNFSVSASEAPLSNTERLRNLVRALHGAVNICLFPPLFFFCALYYTDVVSTGLVLLFLDLRRDSGLAQHPLLRGSSLVFIGISTLFFRQTNIFWVAIFPAGLEIVELLKSHEKPVDKKRDAVTFIQAFTHGWQNGTIHDPPTSEAYVEDYAKLVVSIVTSAIHIPFPIMRAVIPYVCLLACFTGFILVNGSVVLGDKANHVATIHVPQMLYIWPYIFFFSFPLIIPRLRALISPLQLLPHAFLRFRPQNPSKSFPRIVVILGSLIIALFAIHYNTIVHPFVLADNRHYVFYVFRILLRHPLIRYAAAPAYVFCAWAVIWTLGLPIKRSIVNTRQGTEGIVPATSDISSIESKPIIQDQSTDESLGCNTSFTLIWLISTTLCLITAPLVEPRYVITPWILWRLRVASPSPAAFGNQASFPTKSSEPPAPQNALLSRLSFAGKVLAHGDARLYAETLWFLVINAATGYMFLYRGFEWRQEPGVVQRFMW